MAARALHNYIPWLPLGCMIMMMIGVGIWVHYTMVMNNQLLYSMELLGPTVTTDNFGRVEESVVATSATYMIFACGLFGLGLYRKVLSVETDVSGPKPKVIKIYRIINASLHFAWWMIMVWIVVLMGGLAILAILTWVSNKATKQVLATKLAVAIAYASRQGTVDGGMLAAAGGDMLHALLMSNGWPTVASCPSTCANLLMFAFLQVDVANSCVCNTVVLAKVMDATNTALDAVPGMFVGIWFMYIFGDFFKTSLALDFNDAAHDAEGGLMRGSPSMARGYNKL